MFAADLFTAMLTIGGLSVLAFQIGRRAASNCKALFIFTIIATAVFSICFQGDLGWASLVPHSSAVLLANFTPILLAFVAGFACNGLELRPSTRPAIVTALSLLAVVCLFAPLVRPAIAPPEVNPAGETKGFVVLQSHDATCAPASAATLLQLHGIESNEKEMIGRCLTSQFGTEALGLYRGIKLGCEGTEFEVGVASRSPGDWFLKGQLPNVALVRFSENEFGDSILGSHRSRQPTWIAGSGNGEDGHAVVIVDYRDGKWTVADPAIGVIKWSDEELRSRFTGDAIFIARQIRPGAGKIHEMYQTRDSRDERFRREIE